MTHRVWLGLGSNRGEKQKHLARALREIAARGLGRLLKKSSLWRTEPVGMGPAEDFLNAAALFETELEPDAFLQGLMEIETQLGRVRRDPASPEPRTVDLDVLFWDDAIIERPGLVVPHPRLHQRRFVLAPLGELTPDYLHPALGRTLRDLLDELRDPARAERLDAEW